MVYRVLLADSELECWRLYKQIGGDPGIVRMKELILERIEMLRGAGACAFVGGDFNSEVGIGGADRYDLARFVDRAGLLHSAADVEKPSFRRMCWKTMKCEETRIDHLFHAGIGVVVVGADVFDFDSSASDHSTMVGKYKISGSTDKTNSRMVQKLQADVKMESQG